MYNGSHAKANNKPRIRMNKLAILFIAVVMLIGAVVGSTVAFLVTETAPVENKFTYASISTNIKENFDGETKKDVQVVNNGDTAAYIRCDLRPQLGSIRTETSSLPSPAIMITSLS